MKKLLLIFSALLLMLSFCACSYSPDADTKEETTETEGETTIPPETQEKPPVPSVTYTLPEYMVVGDKVQWKYTYDPAGLSISKIDYTESPPITYTLNFDENGMPKNLTWVVEVNETRSEVWEDLYFFDEDGNIETEKRYCEGELQHTYRYTYDEEGRMLSQHTIKRRNGKESLYTLFYDEMGECIGITEKKDSKEETVYKEMVENTYSEDGRLIKTLAPSHEINYEYQLKGDLVTTEKVTFVSGDVRWSYYYQYAYENSKLTRMDSSFEGELTDTTYYTESEFEHYLKWSQWVFRERLP